MRVLLILFVFLGISFQLDAQAEVTQRVYLKDGSVYIGHVLISTDTYVRFQTSYGEVYDIPENEIARIQKTSESRVYFKKGKGVQTKGLYGTYDFQLLFGQGFENPWDSAPSFRASMNASVGMGYQFNQYFSLGLDLGFTFFREHFVASPALEIRSYLYQGPVSPYVRLQGGYGFDLVGNPTPGDIGYTSGPMYHPAIGMRFASRSNSEVHLDFGYRFQHLTTEDVWFTERKVLRRLSLRMGILF